MRSGDMALAFVSRYYGMDHPKANAIWILVVEVIARVLLMLIENCGYSEERAFDAVTKPRFRHRVILWGLCVIAYRDIQKQGDGLEDFDLRQFYGEVREYASTMKQDEFAAMVAEFKDDQDDDDDSIDD